jgi:hypothetical protein
LYRKSPPQLWHSRLVKPYEGHLSHDFNTEERLVVYFNNI